MKGTSGPTKALVFVPPKVDVSSIISVFAPLLALQSAAITPALPAAITITP